MKKIFVAIGIIGFLCFSGMSIGVLNGFSENCYYNILECRTNLGLMLFSGCFWILSLAFIVGGLANSETD